MESTCKINADLNPGDCSFLEPSKIMDCPKSTSFSKNSTVNFQNNVHVGSNVNMMSEHIMGSEILDSFQYPDVYTDIDEKPVLTMTQFQQKAPEAKQYKCDVCEAVFCNSSSVKEHMLQHKRSRPHYCSKCDQYFVQGNNFSAHREQHELENTVQCPVCNKRCKSVGVLTVHMKVHERSESYECGICCKIFGQPSMLVKHMESHTTTPLIKCDICLERLNTLNDLEYHKKKIHHIYDADIYRYKCTICELSFKKRGDLTEHDWNEHFSSEKMSNLSKKWRFVKYEPPSPKLDHHEISVSEIQESMDVNMNEDEAQSRNGPVNESKTVNSTAVPSDKTVMHLRGSNDDAGIVDNANVKGNENGLLLTESKNKENDEPSGRGISNCLQDDKSSEKDKLEEFNDPVEAAVEEHAVDMLYQECENEETNELKKYECDLCSLEFEGSDAVERHMFEHNKLLPHYCRRCDLYFVLARNMKTHMNKHEAEDPLMCSLCNEIFYTTEGLNNHSLTHVEFYPYQCGHCQRGFQIKSAYDLHMRFHSKTLFQCDICFKDFAYKRYLELHKRKEHFIYDKKFRFGCDLCKMKFQTRTPLRDHKRYVHKIEWDQLVSSKGVKHYFRHRRDRSKFITY